MKQPAAMFVGGVGVVEIWGVGIAVAAHNSNTSVVVQAGNTVDSVVLVAAPVEVLVVEKVVERVVEQRAVPVAAPVVVFVNQVALKVYRMKIRSMEVLCRQLSR
jgi:hypothetical protein